MAIPAFDEYGNLRPGVHEATWDEIVDRFGGTTERRRLLSPLRTALDLLAACGCRRAWIDGSFITDVEAIEGRSPRDVDVCWDLAGVDLDRLTVVAAELHPLLGMRDAAIRRFGGDYSPVLEPLVLGLVVDFQVDRQNRPKGIVQLSLTSVGEGGDGR